MPVMNEVEVALTHLLGMGGNPGDTWNHFRTIEMKTDQVEFDDWNLYLLIFEDIIHSHRWVYTWAVSNENHNNRFDYPIMMPHEADSMLRGEIEPWMKVRDCSLRNE